MATTTTSAKVVNNTKGRKNEKEEEHRLSQIHVLESSNKLIVQELKNLHPQERKLFLIKKGYIDQLASNFVQLHQLGAYTTPLTSISLEVYQFCNKNKVPITQRYVQMLLPKEYKMDTKPAGQNRSDIRYDVGADVMEDENPDLFPEEDIDTLSQEEQLKPNPIWGRAEEQLIQKPIDEMSNDELRQVTERTILSEKQKREQLRETARRSEYLQEECEHRKVALDPEVIKPKEPPISAISLDSGPSLSATAAGELKNAWGRVENKLLKYRPTPELDKKIAAGLKVQVELLEPYADEKFRKDILSWFKIEADKCIMGKNASAKRNATKFTPEIQKLLNILKRDLTREQVGDNFLPMLELAAKVLETQDTMLVLNLWYLSMVEPEIAKRVVKMNPKLSALA
jgi:hypothetical protein